MPFWFLPHTAGTNGFSRTRSSIFLTGIARLEALLREKTRCVLNSASTMRGNVTSNVVSR
jgi:hypothetical protein